MIPIPQCSPLEGGGERGSRLRVDIRAKKRCVQNHWCLNLMWEPTGLKPVEGSVYQRSPLVKFYFRHRSPLQMRERGSDQARVPAKRVCAGMVGGRQTEDQSPAVWKQGEGKDTPMAFPPTPFSRGLRLYRAIGSERPIGPEGGERVKETGTHDKLD